MDSGLKYNHNDYCHCLDYKAEICPEDCFRAQLTKELKEAKPPYTHYCMLMGTFRHTGQCPLDKMENSDG